MGAEILREHPKEWAKGSPRTHAGSSRRTDGPLAPCGGGVGGTSSVAPLEPASGLGGTPGKGHPKGTPRERKGCPGEGRGIQRKRHTREGVPRRRKGKPLGRNTSEKEMGPRGSKGHSRVGTGHPSGSVQRGPGHHPQPASTPVSPEPRALGYRGLRRGPRRVVRGAGQVGLAARAVRRHLPALADPNASSERRRGSALLARAALHRLLAAAAALSAREPGRPLPPRRAAPAA